MASDPTGAIPAGFTAWVGAIAGEEGAAWLRDLPTLLAEYATRWSLTLLEPFPDLSFGYVASAIRADGSPSVLKIGLSQPAAALEIAALEQFDGAGAVRLLEADAGHGAMLLERALPGAPLSQVKDDDQATASAAEVMCAIWRPAPDPSPFPTLADWLEGFTQFRVAFGGGSGPLPEAALARAESLGRDLLASTPSQPALLHGDLHHDNMVSAQRAPWLAIDPKGVTGDPCYEAGPFLNNPYERIMGWERREWPARMARRVDILAGRLDFPRERIIAWGIVQATLSTLWGIEAGVDERRWPDRIARADALASLL